MKSKKSQKRRLFLETQKTDLKRFLKRNTGLQAMKKSITRLPNNILVDFAGLTNKFSPPHLAIKTPCNPSGIKDNV
jgi:hypothetical protein